MSIIARFAGQKTPPTASDLRGIGLDCPSPSKGVFGPAKGVLSKPTPDGGLAILIQREIEAAQHQKHLLMGRCKEASASETRMRGMVHSILARGR